MFKIKLPVEGFDKEKKCIYAFTIVDHEGNKFVYIGITKSSNNTGISSPLGRLGTHLKKRGNTHSILKNIQEINPKKVNFLFKFITDLEGQKEEQELIEYFRNQDGYTCLNKTKPFKNTIIINENDFVRMIKNSFKKSNL